MLVIKLIIFFFIIDLKEQSNMNPSQAVDDEEKKEVTWPEKNEAIFIELME